MQTGSLSRLSTQMLSLGKPNTSENNVGGRDNANRQSAKDEDTNTQLWRPALLKTMLWANKTQVGSLPRTRTQRMSFGKPSTSKNNVVAETTQIGSLPRMMTKIFSFGQPSTSKNKFWGRENANRQSAKDDDKKNQLRQAQHL